MKGHKHSEESRQKNSLAHRGKQLSAEHRQKLSVNNGRFWKGKQLSEEHRQKIAEAFTGMLWWNDGVSCKRAKECPGPEWKPGRILKP